ncbi:hypothetical protein EES43_22110 [Streptomyces sp. ADI96-02]|uniref:WXG100 family type VII secretion target n=1 Tax=Streptomyces sp. ADI96-02 TaxID=1522760 RepID=UPI000F54E89D|nr:WXG100 family type VII secretion target [Streptomyces sp. ADI96-02]RPK57408.1 hypothetical protein EES43_22110 [Streptomyces sp. ADI96-02]
MSDENQQELTPAEQHQQDEGRVRAQLVVTDVTETVGRVMGAIGFGNPRTAGRTSFEGHELNAMIDMVENSNPEHLESAGEELWKARDAIRSAAQELADHIEGVDWQGESGNAFRDWGKGLVAHATKLSDFADAAGTQITVAGTGLASVRSAMPPRDSRLVRKSPEDIELPARIKGNPEYEAALKVEKNRQEAINQVNRLASYYSVSEEALANQEPPRFEKKLNVDMPRPEGGGRSLPPTHSSSPHADGSGGGESPDVPPRESTGGPGAVTGGSRHAPTDDLGPAPVLDKGTTTEINSVAAPPAPPTAPDRVAAPSATGTTGSSGVSTPPLAPGFVNPVQGSSGRGSGPAGSSRPVSQFSGGPGKASPSAGGPATAHGNAGSAVGRPGTTGGGASATGRSGGGVHGPAAGASGVTGGRPTAAPGGSPAGGTSRAAGGNGIVGGTPQRAASGTGGARGVARGTVIGGQGGAPARGVSGATGRGVIGGTGGTTGAARPGGRGAAPAAGAHGVVGAARGASGKGPGPQGFTSGGAGLVRGPAGRRNSDRDDEEETGSTRPDYLTEDEETWAVRRPGAVPPVIE